MTVVQCTLFCTMCFAQTNTIKVTSWLSRKVTTHSSLSSRLSPGDAARAGGSGDFEGVRERFCRTGDLEGERLLERE